MTMFDTDAADIHGLVTSILVKTGFRPFGSDGSAWEHPNGTKVTTGYAGGRIRVRRFVPGNDRYSRIPPVTWDVPGVPAESEVLEFIGQSGPAPDLTAEERARVRLFEGGADAPESLRSRLIEEIDNRMYMGGTADDIADAVLALIKGEL